MILISIIISTNVYLNGVEVMRVVQVLVSVFFISINASVMADEAEQDWSFSQVAAYQQVTDKASALFAWAEAEYAEHEEEGLFKRFPQDGKTIQATLNLAKEFKNRAVKAMADGDTTGANALLFAAEATAYYATKMPHLLEKRIESQTQVSNE